MYDKVYKKLKKNNLFWSPEYHHLIFILRKLFYLFIFVKKFLFVT